MGVVNFHNRELNTKEVSSLIEEMEAKKGEQNVLYFSSPGGNTSAMEMLLDYLHGDLSWELVAVANFDSCAFILYSMYQGNKYFTPSATALVHELEHIVSTRDIKKDKHNYPRAKANLVQTNKSFYEMLKRLGIKKEWRKLLKKGEDVILFFDDLKQLKWETLLE